jgi:hypothetical protein
MHRCCFPSSLILKLKIDIYISSAWYCYFLLCWQISDFLGFDCFKKLFMTVNSPYEVGSESKFYVSSAKHVQGLETLWNIVLETSITTIAQDAIILLRTCYAFVSGLFLKPTVSSDLSCMSIGSSIILCKDVFLFGYCCFLCYVLVVWVRFGGFVSFSNVF